MAPNIHISLPHAEDGFKLRVRIFLNAGGDAPDPQVAEHVVPRAGESYSALLAKGAYIILDEVPV